MAGAAEKAKIVELLKALSSSDNSARQQAESLYQTAKQQEPDNIMIGMVGVLGSTDVDEPIRRQCAVLLRQMVSTGPEASFVWSRIKPQHQQQVADELLRRFEAEGAPKMQRKVGEVISQLAEYVCDKDDPRGSLAPGSPCGWPNLLPCVFQLADAATRPEETCDASLRLLKDVVPTLKGDLIAAKQHLGSILQNGLTHASLKIKTAALLLVCEIVEETEKKDWAPLLNTAPLLLQVVQQLVAASEEDLGQEAIQAMTQVASIEPDFYKGLLQQEQMQPALFMANVAKTREGVDSGLRHLALEWLVTFLEKRSKWLAKHVKAYVPLVLEVCMEMMFEIEGTEEDIKAWVLRMDDEEGEEDEDELYHAGEEAIDRVVEAAQMETAGQALFQLIGHYSGQEAWQAKHAALSAVKQTVEYVEDKSHVDEMAKLLIGHVDHMHPRVRYASLHAIGQLANDQAPYFQENHHKVIMPVLLKKMDDAVDRVAAMAMSAFVSFGEELDNSLMIGYAQGFMEKLVEKLRATQHRGVREESITSIAVIAGVIEKDFSKYYDGIMPMLKQFVFHATDQKENRLRGKAFECMSLLGIAVGKEKFLPDAQEAITEMMKTPLEADDVQREYIKEASERICQCLKKDFAPFLPNLLLGIFKTLKFEEASNPGKADAVDEEDDDDFVSVSTHDGKTVRVRTAKFEEMLQSVQLLHTFVTELESAFFDWVTPTAEALLPLISYSDLSLLCDEVRGIALQTWALLIKTARLGATERGIDASLARELLRTALQKTFGVQSETQEPDMLSELASGLSECIKNVGPGILGAQEVEQLVSRKFALIDESFKRTEKYKKKLQEEKTGNQDLPRELGEEEDDADADPDADEEQLRRNYEENLGAVMEVAPKEFLQCLPACMQKIELWLNENQKVLALYLACDLILHLKEESLPAWTVFMPEVFRVLGAEDPDARTAAAYAVNLAAPLASFNEAAPEAFRRLAHLVGSPRPKKRDEKAKLAFDNAVAALFTLAKEKLAFCPPEINAWALVIDKLPLRDDEEEARKVHEKLVDGVLSQDQAWLGGPERPLLGKVLSTLAEVYHVENICKKETEEKILQIFKLLPRDLLQGLAPNFTEKQQKKIEKMLTG